jgi:regulator of vacuolar morphogenesis
MTSRVTDHFKPFFFFFLFFRSRTFPFSFFLFHSFQTKPLNHKMNQDAIQAIFIKQTETRTDPDNKKPYTAYRIDIQAAVRQWHIWKRYSDFTKLHDQLIDTFPSIPMPAHLPHKRIFPPTFSAPDKVEDRRQGLQDYLRTIQSGRDDRWRKTDIWVEFLALPLAVVGTEKQQFTFGSWLDEYDDLMLLTKEIRSLINSRNAHQGQQEVSDAMRCEVKAKKDLMSLSARLGNLETSLLCDNEQIADGEQRRREDKLNQLKMERDVLVQLVNVTRQDLTKKKEPSVVKKQVQGTPSSATMDGRFHGDIGFDTNVKRAVTTSPAIARQGRAFGNAYKQQLLQEIEATKGLDNQELLQYQTQVMKDQDLHVEQFSQLLSRQKEIGLAINHELETQTDLLENLDLQVDKTANKLSFANKKLSKIK